MVQDGMLHHLRVEAGRKLLLSQISKLTHDSAPKT